MSIVISVMQKVWCDILRFGKTLVDTCENWKLQRTKYNNGELWLNSPRTHSIIVLFLIVSYLSFLALLPLFSIPFPPYFLYSQIQRLARPLITVQGKQSHVDLCDFKSRLIYRVSSRTAKVTKETLYCETKSK